MKTIPIPILCPDARLMPSYAHPGDAGCDLRAAESVALLPGQKALVSTGIAVAIPSGYVGLIMPRSGLSKKGIVVIPGTVDSGYRGIIKVQMYNLACMERYIVAVGDRIAQLEILPVERADFIPVDKLEASERGTGGFGSSGK